MRSYVGLVILALCALGFMLMMLGEGGPDETELSQQVSTLTLDNGMKIVVQENHRAPVVVSQIWYKVGGSYEHDGVTGVSHVLEHMMFKGTPAYPDGRFSEVISANGGSENAFTSKDYTAYFQRIASDRLELCLKMEADRMVNLTLDEEEFRKEVEVVKEERRLRTEDKPTALTFERFNALAWINSPYRQPIIGWMEDLDSMTIEDVHEWYKAWYAPNNATLVIVGDVKTGEVFRLAKQYFAALKPAKIPTLKPRSEPEQKGQRRLVAKIPAKIPYLIIGYTVPVLATADNAWEVYALEVLSGLLDGGDSARLTKNLVRGTQIAASAAANYNAYSRRDVKFVLSGLPADGIDMADLENALIGEVKSIIDNPPSRNEMDRVKAQVVASSVYEKDSVFYQGMQLGILETNGLGWERKDEYIDGISSVTPLQVQQVARKYLLESRSTVAVLEPLPLTMKDDLEEEQHAN